MNTLPGRSTIKKYFKPAEPNLSNRYAPSAPMPSTLKTAAERIGTRPKALTPKRVIIISTDKSAAKKPENASKKLFPVMSVEKATNDSKTAELKRLLFILYIIAPAKIEISMNAKINSSVRSNISSFSFRAIMRGFFVITALIFTLCAPF